jgi:hypothetical protein
MGQEDGDRSHPEVLEQCGDGIIGTLPRIDDDCLCA